MYHTSSPTEGLSETNFESRILSLLFSRKKNTEHILSKPITVIRVIKSEFYKEEPIRLWHGVPIGLSFKCVVIVTKTHEPGFALASINALTYTQRHTEGVYQMQRRAKSLDRLKKMTTRRV